MTTIETIAPLGTDEETAENVREANSDLENRVVIQRQDDGQYYLVRWSPGE